MTDVKRLLNEATPLPWNSGWDAVYDSDDLIAVCRRNPSEAAANAYLIQYAVNRLPDYGAAVNALEQLILAVEADASVRLDTDSVGAFITRTRITRKAARDGRTALRCLRGEAKDIPK